MFLLHHLGLIPATLGNVLQSLRCEGEHLQVCVREALSYTSHLHHVSLSHL